MKKFLVNYGTMLIFVMCCFAIAFRSEYFLTRINLENIIKQSAIIGIMACGMFPVLITANIDISVGALLCLSGVLSAKLFGLGAPLILVFILPVLTTMLISLCSSIFVTKFRVHPFIITLGTMYVVRGLVYVVTQEETLTSIAYPIVFLGSGSIYSIPMLSILLFISALVMYIFIHKTRTGIYLQAVGGNLQTAREWGLNPEFLTKLSFVISGMFTGLAGILNTGRMMTVEPQTGVGFEFQVIGAFVVGGGVLFAGEGSVLKTIFGVFIFSIISNGMDLLQVSPFIQLVTRGMLIILVVGISSFLSHRINTDGK